MKRLFIILFLVGLTTQAHAGFITGMMVGSSGKGELRREVQELTEQNNKLKAEINALLAERGLPKKYGVDKAGKEIGSPPRQPLTFAQYFPPMRGESEEEYAARVERIYKLAEDDPSHPVHKIRRDQQRYDYEMMIYQKRLEE